QLGRSHQQFSKRTFPRSSPLATGGLGCGSRSVNGLKGLLKVRSQRRPKTNQKANKTMKNRNIILTAILSLVGSGGLSSTALAAGIPPFNTNVVNTPNVNVVNTATSPVPVQDAENPARNAVQQEVSLSIPPGGSSEPESSIPIPADKI